MMPQFESSSLNQWRTKVDYLLYGVRCPESLYGPKNHWLSLSLIDMYPRTEVHAALPHTTLNQPTWWPHSNPSPHCMCCSHSIKVYVSCWMMHFASYPSVYHPIFTCDCVVFSHNDYLCDILGQVTYKTGENKLTHSDLLFLYPLFLLVSSSLTVINTFSACFFHLCVGRINQRIFGAALTSRFSGLSGSSVPFYCSRSDWLSASQSSLLAYGFSTLALQISQFSVSEMLSGALCSSLSTR